MFLGTYKRETLFGPALQCFRKVEKYIRNTCFRTSRLADWRTGRLAKRDHPSYQSTHTQMNGKGKGKTWYDGVEEWLQKLDLEKEEEGIMKYRKSEWKEDGERTEPEPEPV